MAYRTALFYDSDIALMEHEIIDESSISDWRPEDLQMYLMGIHDFAEKLICKIRCVEKEEK